MEKTITYGNDTAYPTNIIDPDRSFKPEFYIGLTKREYFAAMAMQGWIACQHDGFTAGGDDYAASIADKATACADALITELNKTP